MDVRKPEIQEGDILKLQDSNFNTANVCIVTGYGSTAIGNLSSIHAHVCTANKPVHSITKFGLRALTQSKSADRARKIRVFSVSTGFTKIPSDLNQVPARKQSREVVQLNNCLQR